jgi:hypothetical protein
MTTPSGTCCQTERPGFDTRRLAKKVKTAGYQNPCWSKSPDFDPLSDRLSPACVAKEASQSGDCDERIRTITLYRNAHNLTTKRSKSGDFDRPTTVRRLPTADCQLPTIIPPPSSPAPAIPPFHPPNGFPDNPWLPSRSGSGGKAKGSIPDCEKSGQCGRGSFFVDLFPSQHLPGRLRSRFQRSGFFSRTFQEEYGTSPSEFRKEKRG